jgi:ketosteroid isomerase-like protein/GNAT superfamily N-acetyltransferase
MPPAQDARSPGSIRACGEADHAAILAIVNSAAQAYRGAIPADRWHDPYMAADELEREIRDGVAFWGYERDGALAGVMGLQDLGEVELIRHAYVAPSSQRSGVGGALLEELVGSRTGRVLVGTWAAADWAVRFYERHGFTLLAPERSRALLQAHWSIPERQIETSVVLGNPAEANLAHVLWGYANEAQADPAERPDRAALSAFWHEDGEYHASPEDPDSDVHRGLDAIERHYRRWYEAYPDLRLEPVEGKANGDKVFIWVRFVGHGAGSGLAIDMQLAHVWTLRDGKASRVVEYFDRDEGMRAAGLR